MTERIAQLEAELSVLKQQPTAPAPFDPKVGDLVRLKSMNGPVMCVTAKRVKDVAPLKVDGEYVTVPDIVDCSWFDKNHVYSTATVPVAALIGATG